MAKKTVWIQSSTPRQKFADGKLTVPVTGFWHIARGRSQFHTLCGMDFDSVSLTEDRPKEVGRNRTICRFCTRIASGRHPIFDRASDNKSSRDPDSVGTRAASLYASRGEVVA